MEFSNETLTTARKYNVEPRAVLFARLLASGADRAEAFYCLYHRGTKKPSREECNTKAAEMLENNPGMKVLITRLKTTKNVNNAKDKDVQKSIEEEKNEKGREDVNKYTDKSFIIAKLAEAARGATGKELAQILMNIADLQRMKQEETKNDDEKRVFYLPYVSHCRTCKILSLFKEFSSV